MEVKNTLDHEKPQSMNRRIRQDIQQMFIDVYGERKTIKIKQKQRKKSMSSDMHLIQEFQKNLTTIFVKNKASNKRKQKKTFLN